MFKKIAICALLAAGIAGAETYKVTLYQPSVVKGTQLKPGDYRLNVENNKATFLVGKKSVEAAVKVQSGDQKFDATTVRYVGTAGSISEIRVGGTTTTLIFEN